MKCILNMFMNSLLWTWKGGINLCILIIPNKHKCLTHDNGDSKITWCVLRISMLSWLTLTPQCIQMATTYDFQLKVFPLCYRYYIHIISKYIDNVNYDEHINIILSNTIFSQILYCQRTWYLSVMLRDKEMTRFTVIVFYWKAKVFWH